MTESAEAGVQKVVSRPRLLSLVAQALSVVFAVLVALAIDEWWESREDAELGRRGVASIAVEIRNNLRVLEDRRAATDRVLAGIDTALLALQRGDSNATVSVDYSVALLSSAAWETGQITRAVSFVDIERVIRIADVYNLQAFFLRNQERLTDMLGDMTDVGEDPAKAIANVGRRYHQVASFRDALAQSYRCLLIELEDRTPTPADGCDESEERSTALDASDQGTRAPVSPP